MSDVENRIEELLTMDMSAQALNNALFSYQGLFNQIAHNEEERRRVSNSPLFQQAQARITELLLSEASEIRRKYRKPGKTVRGRAIGLKRLPLPTTKSRPAPTSKRGRSPLVKKHRKSG